MNNLMEHPLVVQGQQEEGSFASAIPQKFLPASRNYAGDSSAQAYFQNEIYPVMEWTRSDRVALEEEWNEIREMVSMKHGAGRRYFGRSDSYMPIYKKERRKMMSTLKKGLFPSDEYFDVTDRGTGDPERAKPVKCIMQWDFETNANIRAKMKPNIGQLCDYGTAPLKYWYKKQIVTQGTATSRKGALARMFAPEHSFKSYCKEGLAVSPRNLFYWYIYPNTCESLDDASLIFEDIDIPMSFVEMMKFAKRWHSVDEIIAMAGSPNMIPEHQRNQMALLMSRGMGLQQPGTGEPATKLGTMLTVTESWTFMQLPRDAYLEHEDWRLPLPVMVTSFGNVAVEIRRNPFYHQKPPYAVARADWEPGLFYGNAQGKIIKPMQLLVNDFMNQTNDNGIIGLNPISIWDVGKMAGVPSSYYPGAPWYVQGNPSEAVKFDRPPIDQVQMGMMVTNMLIGLAEGSGGSPPDYNSRAKASNTATGMSIAQRNVQTPIADDVEDIENDQMLPILWGGWKNNVQYRNEDVMVSIAGEMIRVSPDMLLIEAEFRCLAASQAANAQVRTQQMINVVQLITPALPMILQQGYIVDFVALFRRLWTDGFGLRGFTDFIKKGQAAPQMGPPRPDQQAGVVNEQQDNYRSALQQVEGQFGDNAGAQPGEADDFSMVRDQADDMAAMMGGQQ